MRIGPLGFAWLNDRVTNRSLGNFTAAFIFLGIIGLELTAQAVMEKMDELRTGRYDNSMWTVSQLEVEYQRFLLAIHEAIEVVPPSRAQVTCPPVVPHS